MRLWHTDLIPYLPRQQLLSQWRECVCIAKSLAEKGTPNHILVNKILDYGCEDFLIYGEKIINEMKTRGYKISYESVHKFYNYNKRWRDRRKEDLKGLKPKFASSGPIFQYWHNERYLIQCIHNLEEKYDCGGVSEEEWNVFYKGSVLLVRKCFADRIRSGETKMKADRIHDMAVVSAYTGRLMGKFSDFHGYCEKLLGKPIWTHQFPQYADQIKTESTPAWEELISRCNDEEKKILITAVEKTITDEERSAFVNLSDKWTEEAKIMIEL